MSFTKDIREYAGTAIEQGRQLVGNAAGTAAELRTQAERAVNPAALRAAAEPYLAQARGYTHSVTDRAEDWLNTARKDPRFAKAYDTAGSVGTAVLGVVQERVLRPVQTLTGLGSTPTAESATAESATAEQPAVPVTKPGGGKNAD